MRAASSSATSGRRPSELPNSRRAHSNRDLVWPRIRRFRKLKQNHRPRNRGDARRAQLRPAHGCHPILPLRGPGSRGALSHSAPPTAAPLPGCAGPGPTTLGRPDGHTCTVRAALAANSSSLSTRPLRQPATQDLSMPIHGDKDEFWGCPRASKLVCRGAVATSRQEVYESERVILA
jgi:hypothetical protein